MALPRWQETGGRDFVFFHSHSGYEWDDVDTTNKYQEMLCHDFQVRCPAALCPAGCVGTHQTGLCMLLWNVDSHP